MSPTKRRPIRSGSNSTQVEKTAEHIHSAVIAHLTKRRVVKGVIGLVALVIIAGGVSWYNSVYTSPEHVFWSMVSNNLSTKSITRESTQTYGTITNVGQTQIMFNPTPVVRDTRDINGQDSGRPIHVVTETISTPKGDYKRYARIERPMNKDKRKSDYSKVYNMWILDKDTSANGFSGLFVDSIFSPILFGNFNPSQREELLKLLHSGYKVDFKNVKKLKENRRNIYTYQVKIPIKTYIKTANYYAKLQNLRKTDQFNPNDYHVMDEMSITVSVGVGSRQITQIDYKSLNIKEKYSAYGVTTDIKVPSKTVSPETQQKAISSVK